MKGFSAILIQIVSYPCFSRSLDMGSANTRTHSIDVAGSADIVSHSDNASSSTDDQYVVQSSVVD